MTAAQHRAVLIERRTPLLILTFARVARERQCDTASVTTLLPAFDGNWRVAVEVLTAAQCADGTEPTPPEPIKARSIGSTEPEPVRPDHHASRTHSKAHAHHTHAADRWKG